jgi:hypothetical protein
MSDADDLTLHAMVTEVRTDVKWLKEKFADVDELDTRLRTVERRQSWMAGVVAVIGAFAARHGLPDISYLLGSTHL